MSGRLRRRAHRQEADWVLAMRDSPRRNHWQPLIESDQVAASELLGARSPESTEGSLLSEIPPWCLRVTTWIGVVVLLGVVVLGLDFATGVSGRYPQALRKDLQ